MPEQTMNKNVLTFSGLGDSMQLVRGSRHIFESTFHPSQGKWNEKLKGWMVSNEIVASLRRGDPTTTKKYHREGSDSEDSSVYSARRKGDDDISGSEHVDTDEEETKSSRKFSKYSKPVAKLYDTKTTEKKPTDDLYDFYNSFATKPKTFKTRHGLSPSGSEGEDKLVESESSSDSSYLSSDDDGFPSPHSPRKNYSKKTTETISKLNDKVRTLERKVADIELRYVTSAPPPVPESSIRK